MHSSRENTPYITQLIIIDNIVRKILYNYASILDTCLLWGNSHDEIFEKHFKIDAF